MKVTLLDHMGSDNAVADAARVSFEKQSANYTDSENARLISYLAYHNHWSPFSHQFIKFRIKAPMFVARQLAKHQVTLPTRGTLITSNGGKKVSLMVNLQITSWEPGGSSRYAAR